MWESDCSRRKYAARNLKVDLEPGPHPEVSTYPIMNMVMQHRFEHAWPPQAGVQIRFSQSGTTLIAAGENFKYPGRI